MVGAEQRPFSYAEAGVDIEAGDRAVSLMRASVEATFSKGVISRLGAFGAAVRSPGSEELLISSADGVGTKTCLVQSDEEASGVGRDLVYHCINDILTCGARPLFFLDYLAFARLQPSRAAALVSGMSAACVAQGCALVGGETAEMPDVYREDAFDVAGFIVGTVSAERFLDGSAVALGDLLIGIPSAGLHTNGFSLARQLLGSVLASPCGGVTVREALLAEHRCYLPAIMPLLDSKIVHGLAHITGGGLPNNLPRMLPAGLAAHLEPGSWLMPPVFDLLDRQGLAREELFRTFNMGIGMVIACAERDAPAVQQSIADAVLIGQVVAQQGTRRVEGI